MKASTIFSKTMKFAWMKLALGLATAVISGILFLLFAGIAALLGSDEGFGIGVIVWLFATVAVYYIVNLYFGYLVKAGHVAIISQAVTTGTIPDNQFEVAKDIVKERFATSNAYLVIDRLVSGAVSQLQKGLDKVDHLLGGIPGVSMIINILQLFVGVALNYVDECCLGYTFINPEKNAFEAAADGVVIYFQNWKKLLKSAVKTSLIVILLTILAWVVPFILLTMLFAALDWPGFIAFIIAIMIALAVKSAFIDSYIMISMMVSYMEVAPTTEITFDLYEKLCHLSRKFKELFDKGHDKAGQISNI